MIRDENGKCQCPEGLQMGPNNMCVECKVPGCKTCSSTNTEICEECENCHTNLIDGKCVCP